MKPSFSLRQRKESLQKFETEVFDILIIGGGITGAAVARDAATRGLKVALVEQNDFASGTSSRSTKLIHGGLRYLENKEFKLVFEALSERSRLLETDPHLIHPLEFYLPVYREDRHGMNLLSLGLWIYDFLSIFRTPGLHQRLSRRQLKKRIPFLKDEGLRGGFKYFDASMWDDLLTVEILAAAQEEGAAIAHYVKAENPQFSSDGRIIGFDLVDQLEEKNPLFIRAEQTIVCTGPWTDLTGKILDSQWKPWLAPSKGVHLTFDLKKIPLPGAILMNHPHDGRISFAIPRTDFGQGIVIVGTTDSAAPQNPSDVRVKKEDVDYLMGMLNQYFPELKLGYSDILSGYAGVRPLVGDSETSDLKDVSREHVIKEGVGHTVVVAGGKYTTHRTMAEEIVDFAVDTWRSYYRQGKAPAVPSVSAARTKKPTNPRVVKKEVEMAKYAHASQPIEAELWGLYGANAPFVKSLVEEGDQLQISGFPCLEAQLRYAIRFYMVVRLTDFIFRRLPLHLCIENIDRSVLEPLARVWAKELDRSSEEMESEIENTLLFIHETLGWKKALK
ncbi:MAG: hypothetical protein CL678_08075 [Bdellovibrionaceae bacterium]|nr:hypothetical protein [Pseudobdellovibrionaceae bacterium]|tara:strand:- start:353 stop:2029 length:1677 start_codon:yes stop_codon:yes gene_type:complete